MNTGKSGHTGRVWSIVAGEYDGMYRIWSLITEELARGQDADDIADCVALAIREWQLQNETEV